MHVIAFITVIKYKINKFNIFTTMLKNEGYLLNVILVLQQYLNY